MGRGSRPSVRWKRDRQRKKKTRVRRQAAAAHKQRKGAG